MTQFASIVGFARTILIILLVYYGLKILSRLFAPVLIRYMSKKVEKRFGQQFNTYQNRSQQKEGETTIHKTPSQNQTSNKDIGEYVDYEEID